MTMKITWIILLFVAIPVLSQERADENESEKYPTSFALQIRGLAHNRFVEPSILTQTNDTVISSIGMRNGFSFGGVIRRRYTDELGFEIGLIHNKRYFNLSSSPTDTNVTYTSHFAFTNYELPVKGLVFVKFSNSIFVNVGLGMTALYKPSSVYVQVDDLPVKRSASFEGYAFRKFGFNVDAQIGVEYRTRNSGIFYLGGSASIPTSPLFAFISVYRSQNECIRVDQAQFIRSPYFTLDLRYYFPKIRNKGDQPNKSLLD